jgi:hypothetical protein
VVVVDGDATSCPACTIAIERQHVTLYCAFLLQNHGAQLAEFVHIDLCAFWENKFNGKKCVYFLCFFDPVSLCIKIT